MKKVGLYIHIPFCRQKCHYCDFNSVPWKKQQGTRFLAAVNKEIELLADKYSVRAETIFFGGGTPTILTGRQLANLLSQIKSQFELAVELEISVEVNPETAEEKKLKLLQDAGVNRVSFGAQALNDFQLAELGRRHTVQEVVDSYYLARKIGFENINLDLMFALPGQKLSDWRRTLRQVCQLKPEHLSCYNLKLEPGTPLYNWAQQGKISLPSEEEDLEMYQLTQKLLTEAGYDQYEISNFAQPGFECRHNKIYWLNQPYLGVGPGAHFYDGEGRGYNYSDLDKYCSKLEAGELPTAKYNQLSRAEQIEETMMMGLRLNQGISLTDFESRYNCSVYDLYEPEVRNLLQKDLINVEKDKLFLTERGRVLANRVLAKFLLS